MAIKGLRKHHTYNYSPCTCEYTPWWGSPGELKDGGEQHGTNRWQAFLRLCISRVFSTINIIFTRLILITLSSFFKFALSEMPYPKLSLILYKYYLHGSKACYIPVLEITQKLCILKVIITLQVIVYNYIWDRLLWFSRGVPIYSGCLGWFLSTLHITPRVLTEMQTGSSPDLCVVFRKQKSPKYSCSIVFLV